MKIQGILQRNGIGCTQVCRWLVIGLATIGIGGRLSPCSWAAEYVVHVSVDGLRPDYLQTQINAGNAPNFKRFQDEGAWTNNARTDYTHTITLPNHTSMLTGRPVLQPAGLPAQTQHGYTSNSDPAAATTLHNNTDPDWYKASTFDVVHDAGFSTALYASKNKFVIYEQSYNAANGAPHANGADKINVFVNPEVTLTMQNQMLAGLAANHFKYTFLHYADTDDAGHGSGWGTPTYMSAINTIDGYLGQLFNLINTDTTMAGKTAIVLSADHGGTGTGHSGSTVATNYTIPFYAWGAGVGHGDLYNFNTDTRLNRGTGQPTYVTAGGQPIRNGDGGNLALSLLGLDAIPGSLINKTQNLRVTTAGDLNADNTVDAADFVAWKKGAGAFTPDTYSTWRSKFGTSAGSGAEAGSGAVVPEPTTAVMLLAATLLFAVVRGLRSRKTI